MIGADDIRKLLEVRHSKDIFEAEIQTPCGRRIDGLAVRRSWTRANVLGYEIKVSRRDFVADEKWRDYLPYCNEFYFVTAPGVCDARELPAEAGLVVSSANASRLYTKKKAPQRESSSPELQEMFRAILICRHGQDALDYNRRAGTGVEYWREWLGRKRENQTIGHRVSTRLREKYREDVEHTRDRQDRLEGQLDDFTDIREMLEKMGIAPGEWQKKERVRRRLQGPRPEHVVRALDRIGREIEALREKFEAQT